MYKNMIMHKKYDLELKYSLIPSSFNRLPHLVHFTTENAQKMFTSSFSYQTIKSGFDPFCFLNYKDYTGLQWCFRQELNNHISVCDILCHSYI